IDEVFDDQEKEAEKLVRRRRYDAVAAYLAARPGARDVEDARAELFRLAALIEAFDAAVRHADDYLAAYPTGPYEPSAPPTKAEPPGKLGRTSDANAAYDSTTRAVSVAKNGEATVVATWTSYAKWLESTGDLESAKGAWRGLRAATATSTNAKYVSYTVDEQ